MRLDTNLDENVAVEVLDCRLARLSKPNRASRVVYPVFGAELLLRCGHCFPGKIRNQHALRDRVLEIRRNSPQRLECGLHLCAMEAVRRLEHRRLEPFLLEHIHSVLDRLLAAREHRSIGTVEGRHLNLRSE